MNDVEIKLLPYPDPIVQSLVAATLRDLSERYGGDGDATPIEHSDFDPPNGAFLVAFVGGKPVACGAWRSHGDDGLVAEIKRMYTTPPARGRGLARRVLAAVEESARGYGRKRIILETGDRQPEAIALYQTSGYELIENFGFYREQAGVLSYGRDL